MSVSEPSALLLGGVLLLALLLLGGAMALYLRWRHAERRLARLEAELALYCDASHRVAQTLEEMLLSRVKPASVAHTSRRYLINQARERLKAGDSLPRIRRALGLSFDEARLLERASTVAARGSALADSRSAFADSGSAFVDSGSALVESGAPDPRASDSALEPAA